MLDAAVAEAHKGKRKIEWYEVYAGEKAKKLFDNRLPEEIAGIGRSHRLKRP